eukprot:1596478-Rhodomonas_salina.1
MAGTDTEYAPTRLLRDGRCDGGCYAFATRCPVLIKSRLLRDSYAVSGTELGYGATRRIELGREEDAHE